MATLSDVAKKANVSKMTVSRVINHPEKVTDELKELVFAAMKELSYKPNIAAKALANNRTQIIKFLILEEMDTTEPYYMTLLTGIAKSLDTHQYALQLVTETSFDRGQSDGYIITGMRDNDYGWIDSLDKPFILFGENRYGYDCVDTDNYQGTVLATEHVLAKGYEDIVFIGMDVPEPFAVSREDGYCHVLKSMNKEPNIYRFPNSSRVASEFIETHVTLFPPKTAFVCASDRLALGIERGLLGQQKKIPEDYGVVGFDGVFLDQIASPLLTTVKQPVIEMGMACGEMLVTKIKEKGQSQGQQSFDPILVERDST